MQVFGTSLLASFLKLYALPTSLYRQCVCPAQPQKMSPPKCPYRKVHYSVYVHVNSVEECVEKYTIQKPAPVMLLLK